MKALDALNVLNDLSASQRGFFTAAQARMLGVSALDLSRLESNRQIERMAHGLYRSCAAPPFREEDVWAEWLLLNPEEPAWKRSRNGFQGAASHETAAWLLGLGELNPFPVTFTLPKRRQTKREGIRFVRGYLDPNEVEIIAGIPTTRPARTILDLLLDGEDLSLVSSVMRDAIGMEDKLLGEQFIRKVDALGKRYGLPAGESLYERLRR